MKTPRHFLSLLDLSPAELQAVIARASELKKLKHAGEAHATLQGRVLAIIFEKSSTRTRVSFEAGMSQLGGSAMFLSPSDTQLGRGEPVEDSARVISSMVDCVMIRTFEHEMVETFAKHSSVPVINGLTDCYIPVNFWLTCKPLPNIVVRSKAKPSPGLAMATTCATRT